MIQKYEASNIYYKSCESNVEVLTKQLEDENIR